MVHIRIKDRTLIIDLLGFSTIKMLRISPQIFGVHGGSAAVNRGPDFVQHLVQSPLAPEQGTGPVTAHRPIKLSFA